MDVGENTNIGEERSEMRALFSKIILTPPNA